MMNITFLPNFPENPSNPARVHVPTGEIQINRMQWEILTPAQREFVLQHEIGHYRMKTYDEKIADQYALQQLALKKKDSLWDFITSVRTISKDDSARVFSAEKSALQVAARTGSKEAKELLARYYAGADGTLSEETEGGTSSAERAPEGSHPQGALKDKVWVAVVAIFFVVGIVICLKRK